MGTLAITSASTSFAQENLGVSAEALLRKALGPDVHLIGYFSEKWQQLESKEDTNGAHMSMAFRTSNSAVVFESDGENYVLTPQGNYKIDLKYINPSQWEAMKDALKRNKGNSDGTSYGLDKNGNIVGPNQIKIIQASSSLNTPPAAGQSYAIYNVASDDIKKDFDPKNNELVAAEQRAAFQKEVESLLKKYPRVDIAISTKEPGNAGVYSKSIEETDTLMAGNSSTNSANFFSRPTKPKDW